MSMTILNLRSFFLSAQICCVELNVTSCATACQQRYRYGPAVRSLANLQLLSRVTSHSFYYPIPHPVLCSPLAAKRKERITENKNKVARKQFAPLLRQQNYF